MVWIFVHYVALDKLQEKTHRQGFWPAPEYLRVSPKVFVSLRDSASTCCEQYIKSDFLHFWGPYVLLRSDFYSKGQAQCPLYGYVLAQINKA